MRPTSLFVMLVTLFLALSPALAADSAEYRVENIYVEAESANAAEARQKAISGGERIAFEKLMEQMVPPAQKAQSPKPSVTEIAGMVAGFEVTSEKMTDQRYRAKITYLFLRDKIDDLLANIPAQAVVAAKRKVLVIPVLTQNGSSVLWGTNAWRTAVQQQASGAQAVSILVPSGDTDDMNAGSLEDVLAAEPTVIDYFAAKYTAEDVILLEANFSGAAGSPRTLKLFVRPAKGSGINRYENNITSEGLEDDAAMATEGARQLLNVLDKSYAALAPAEVTLPAGGTSGATSIKATARYTSLKDWGEISQKLHNNAAIKDVQVEQFVTGNVQLKLQLGMSPEEARLVLGQDGIALDQENGAWVIRRLNVE